MSLKFMPPEMNPQYFFAESQKKKLVAIQQEINRVKTLEGKNYDSLFIEEIL